MADASRRGGATAARDSLAAAHLLESYLAGQAASDGARPMSDDWLTEDPFADPDDPAAREREQRRLEREEKRRQEARARSEAARGRAGRPPPAPAPSSPPRTEPPTSASTDRRR